MSITEKLLEQSPDGITVEQISGLSQLDYNQYCSEVLLNAQHSDVNDCINVEYFLYGRWVEYGFSRLNFEDYHYRIKQEPKMIELDYTDDLLGEKAVNTKQPKVKVLITGQYDKGVNMYEAYYSYNELRKNFVRPNGTKFEKVAK